jgi:hypothetical protein
VCDVRTQTLRRRSLFFRFQLRDACVHRFCGHRRMRLAIPATGSTISFCTNALINRTARRG